MLVTPQTHSCGLVLPLCLTQDPRGQITRGRLGVVRANYVTDLQHTLALAGNDSLRFGKLFVKTRNRGAGDKLLTKPDGQMIHLLGTPVQDGLARLLNSGIRCRKEKEGCPADRCPRQQPRARNLHLLWRTT